MGVQFGTIGVLMIGAMVAVPIGHDHRMDGGAFLGALWAFIGVPLFVGIRSRQAHRAVLLAALALLLLCPVVYAVADRMAVEFEQLRDGYFLGAFSAALLASSTWLVSSYRAGKRVQLAAAAIAVTSSVLAILALLWMVIYFE